MLGDSNTGNDVFDSVGFRGGRLFSSDSMYPDSLQGYAPTVRGIARTPAKVVVRQNGYVIYQSYVQPGAFAITDLNPTSSSGDLEVTVEETAVSNAIPCRTPPCRCCSVKVAGSMTSWPGITEAVTAIRTRRSSPGTLITGLANGYTLYGGTQLASRYTAVAIGAGKTSVTGGGVGRYHPCPQPAGGRQPP